MSYITLDFPVWVQNPVVDKKSDFLLKPLFMPFPIVSNRRFEQAVISFQNEVRRYFNGFILNREEIEKLLWFKFNPDVEFEIYPLEFTAGKQYVRGSFAVASFELQGHLFVCLPAFDHYFFMATPNDKGKFDVEGEVIEVIQKLIREIKKETRAKLDISEYTATKGEFITEVSLSFSVADEAFPFEQSPLDFFFAQMGGNSEFSGAVEIEKVGYNFNDNFPSSLKRAYYREEEVERLKQIVYQGENTPIVLLGEEGVGKNSIMQEVVYRYCDENRNVKYNKLERVWYIDPTRIISGMSIIGMWQKRFESILKFVIGRRKRFGQKTDKIVIDNVVAMLRIGKSSQNSMTLSDVLKPYLEKRQLQLILIATPEQWKVFQEKDRRFADLFQILRVEEPNLETAVSMVVDQRRHLEIEYNCSISTMALSQIFTIHRNYLKHRALPGAVLKLLHQLAIKYKHQGVDAAEVRQEFESYSGLHKEIFDETYKFEKAEVRNIIGQNLIGQPEAVNCLSRVIHLIKSKLNDPEKPLGSYLFIGPTGVGKTQAAKVLCNYLMGSEEHLLRFDMNEYIDPYAIQRLIGDYYNPEGQLTGRVRYKPFGIILFDEIEKAHPSVHDLLLQVLDDGRLTDSLGRTVDFTNTIIIMTSNVGARDAANKLGFTDNAVNEGQSYRKAVERQFRPEFVNRIDQIVIFNSLKLDHIYNIAKLQIQELLSRDGFVRRTTILNISKDALKWVAERGYNEKMGGRALKRQIERDLTTLSADQLIATYSARPIIFEISLKDGKLNPKITPLQFIRPLSKGWLPKLPTEKQGKRFYSRILKELENIEHRVTNEDFDTVIPLNTNDNLDWQYYWFKELISDFKERIRRIILGYGHQILDEAPVTAFRLKRISSAWSIDSKNLKNKINDKMFQKDGMDEIRDVFRYGQTHFDRADSQFMKDLLDFEFLKIFANGYFENRFEKIEIELNSCITNLGDREVTFLLDNYTDLFSALELQYHRTKKINKITVEGYGLYDLLKSEDGFHLFHFPHQNPIPIRVQVKKEGGSTEDQKTPRVIRVYDGDETVTDIRTGFTNTKNILPPEMKLFIYGGLSVHQN